MTETIKIFVENSKKEYKFVPPVRIKDLLTKEKCCSVGHLVAWRVNHILRPLSWVIEEDSTVEFVDTSSFVGMEVYRRSLLFLLVMASFEVLGCDVDVLHSMSNGYYCELAGGRKITEDEVKLLEDKIKEYVKQDKRFEDVILPRDRVIKLFERQGYKEKADLFRWVAVDPVEVYRCGDTYNCFYGPLVPSTGYLKVFALRHFSPGFVIQFPTVAYPDTLPPFKPLKKLSEVFREYNEWLSILGLSTMASLHRKVSEGEALDLILVSEALHSRKLAMIVDEVEKRRDVMLVCIAGPSASGKTTTAKRLAIQFKVKGYDPHVISLDNYFVDREKTPKDEHGNYDFEALEALDLELINEHLNALLNGEGVWLPKYNFVTGKRERGDYLKLTENSILIIEGIHGLNEALTEMIPKERKYKIFVSPLTGLNLDRHNRVSTTDNRLLRRLVRDARKRGKSPESTLKQWPSVIRGANRYIFPYQEQADAMFNSALVYEIPVLKGYAEPLLRTIPEDSPQYGEAQRLLSFLLYVPVIPSDNVPINSILREFIGGSCFEE